MLVRFFPLKTFHQSHNVPAYIFGHGCNGILVRHLVKVKRSPEKMVQTVGKHKLSSRCRVSCKFIQNAENSFFGILKSFFGNCIGTYAVLIHYAVGFFQ